MFPLLAQGPGMAPAPAGLVPTPVAIEGRWAPFAIPGDVRVIATLEELVPLGQVLAGSLERLLGQTVALEVGGGRAGDIILTPGFLPEEYQDHPEAYSIEVFGDNVSIAGRTPAGGARAVARFLQLVEQDPESGSWSVPAVKLLDKPAQAWRGLMLDLARFPHPVEAVEEALDLAFLFSLNTVHLHLTDDQAFTFPASILPARSAAGQPGPNRGYTRGQLAGLVSYASARGITLVPEIEMPAHASALVRARPDLFGTTDEAGEAKSTGVVNMASERAYDALETLLAEVAEVFPSAPVIHVGGDEVWAPQLLKTAEFAAFAAEHGIPLTVEDGAVRELLHHFLARVTGMVRELGRRPAVWEGFQPSTSDSRRIGDDVLVLSWSQNSQTPEALLRAGYGVLNCGWDPLYIVPAQGWAAGLERAYDWKPTQVRARFDGRAVDLPAESRLEGAMICVWEQRPESIVPGVLRVLPEIAERMWGSGNAPDAWQGFRPHAEQARERALRILRPVTMSAEGAHLGRGTAFADRVQVSLASSAPGVLRFERSAAYGTPVTAQSPVYDGKPIELEASAVVAARLFDAQGRPQGGTTETRFEHAPAVWNFEAFRMPRSGEPDWDAVFAAAPIGTGGLVRPSQERIADINRELFAKVNPAAHVDTRPLSWRTLDVSQRIDPLRSRIWGRHAMRMRGQMNVPVAGTWTLRVGTRGSAARVLMGGKLVATCGAEPDSVQLDLAAGVHAIEIQYAMLDVHDDLQASLLAPDSKDEAGQPLTDALLATADWVAPEDLIAWDD